MNITNMVGAETSKNAVKANGEVLLERVEKILSDGKWNGRAGTVFWAGRYCS
jgi:hypothetical protein